MIKELSLYNGEVRISFDSGTPERPRHIYRDERDKILFSVTKATGVVDKSGALMGWAVKMMGLFLLAEKEKGNKIITEEMITKAKREYRRIRDEAADIGTEIHEWVSDWILGKKPEMPDNERVVNGITAFLEFQKQHKAKWIFSERIVYSRKHKFVGMCDGGSINDSTILSVDDFKSSKGIYNEMRFQVSGYHLALKEEIDYLLSIPFKSIKKAEDRKLVKAYIKYGGLKQRRIIKFGKLTGDFEVKILDSEEKDRKAFVNCLNLSKRVDELKKNNGYR